MSPIGDKNPVFAKIKPAKSRAYDFDPISVFIEGLFHAPGRVARRRGSKAGGVGKHRHRAAVIHWAQEDERGALERASGARPPPTEQGCRVARHRHRRRPQMPCHRAQPPPGRRPPRRVQGSAASGDFLQLAAKPLRAKTLDLFTNHEAIIRVVRSDVLAKRRRLARSADAM